MNIYNISDRNTWALLPIIGFSIEEREVIFGFLCFAFIIAF